MLRYERVALAPREGSREVLHHARVGVDRCERREVSLAPATQAAVARCALAGARRRAQVRSALGRELDRQRLQLVDERRFRVTRARPPSSISG